MKIWISLLLSHLLVCIVQAELKQIEFANLTENKPAVTASGFLVDDNGTLATVAQLQSDPTKASVKNAAGEAVKLKLIAYDRFSRMTLLRIPESERKGVTVIKDIVRQGEVKPGDVIYFDAKNAADKSNPGRMVNEVRKFNGRILPIAFILANMSKEVTTGGAVVNDAGQLIGLTYQQVGDKMSAYVLPAEVISQLLSYADAKNGEVYKACWIGVNMDDRNAMAKIIGVRPDSPAKKSGMKVGDVVIGIDGREVNNFEEVANAFFFLKKDKPTNFKVIRGVNVLNISIKPEINPIFK